MIQIIYLTKVTVVKQHNWFFIYTEKLYIYIYIYIYIYSLINQKLQFIVVLVIN